MALSRKRRTPDRQKESPGLKGLGFCSVFSAVCESPDAELARAAQAAACTAGIAPTEAAYSSPHVQSELVTGSPPFRLSDSSQWTALKAMPSRRGGLREVTVGRGRDARFTSRGWDAGLSLSLYCPPPGSFSRTRLSGNAETAKEYIGGHSNPAQPSGRSELHP